MALRNLLSLLTFLCAHHSVATTLETFSNGEVADADAINANFPTLLTAINGVENGALTCSTYSSTTSSSVSCPSGEVMTGGGLSLTDSAGNPVLDIASTSYPASNGWQCASSDTNPDHTATCFVRCCGTSEAEEPLGFGSYCTSNYCLQAEAYYEGFVENILYRAILKEGEYRTFPMDVDSSFNFPPDNIGGMSWWLRWQDQEFHVNNIDEDCLASEGAWYNCMTDWEHDDILRDAMLSGEIEIKPGPLGVLNEFQINNAAGYNLRFQSQLDTGHVASDAALASEGYTIYRVSPGTGNQDNNRCQEHEIPFLTQLIDGIGFEGTSLSINSSTALIPNPSTFPMSWWAGSAARILVCSDSPVGTYNVGFVAIDGVGDKRFLGYVNVKVLTDYRDGGEVVPD